MRDILNGLNKQQIKAVTYEQGPLLVLAGPGAGKTTVLTKRIAYILSSTKGEHFKLLALTFTNKAAKEMKERVERLVDNEVKRVFIGTFHGFSHELIRAYGNYIGIPKDFIIYDKPEDYIKLLIDGVRKRVKQELKGYVESTILSEKYRNMIIIEEMAPKFYYIINKLKNKSIFHEGLGKGCKEQSEELELIIKIYSKELKNVSALDFPDLILYTIKLLKEKPFILKQVQTIYKHILIDEGQDTNKYQFELITTICSEDFKNLFIVADEDQLIFEWNNARFEYLLSLKNKYGAETIQLYESYRCPHQILKAANCLIKHNKIRFESKEELIPKRGKSEKSIDIKFWENQDVEARFVCNKIKEFNRYTDTCVISRNRYILKNIKEKLENISIPYYVPMGQERFSTREMNLIINLMRLVSNENDKVHLYYICEYLEINYEDIVEDVIGNTLLQNFLDVVKKNIRLKEINTILEKFRNNKNRFKIYYDELKKNIIGSDNKDEDLIQDIQLFEQIYKNYTISRHVTEKNLSDFLNYIILSPKKDLNKRGIALLTVHAAKGLEFDYVFLVSMNQGIFPDYRAIRSNRALEEERRNCFVAITRAKEKLFISYIKFGDTRYGLREYEPSQFLKEMGLIS